MLFKLIILIIILSAEFIISYMSNVWLFFALTLLTMYATAMWFILTHWRLKWS